jgi:hypothetical protein
MIRSGFGVFGTKIEIIDAACDHDDHSGIGEIGLHLRATPSGAV